MAQYRMKGKYKKVADYFANNYSKSELENLSTILGVSPNVATRFINGTNPLDLNAVAKLTAYAPERFPFEKLIQENPCMFDI